MRGPIVQYLTTQSQKDGKMNKESANDNDSQVELSFEDLGPEAQEVTGGVYADKLPKYIVDRLKTTGWAPVDSDELLYVIIEYDYFFDGEEYLSKFSSAAIEYGDNCIFLTESEIEPKSLDSLLDAAFDPELAYCQFNNLI